MGAIADVIQALGGPGLVPARSAGELRDALRTGLPYASLSAVASGFDLPAGRSLYSPALPANPSGGGLGIQ